MIDVKIINNKRSKNGFTLIELLVSIAILSIVALLTVSIQASGIRIFAKGNQLAKEQNSSRLASDFITDQIRFAKSMQILYDIPTPEAGFYDIFINNGKIIFHEEGLVKNPIAFNSEDEFILEFRKVSGSMVDFRVAKVGETHYGIDSSVAVLNIRTTAPHEIVDPMASVGIGVRYSLNALNSVQKLERDMLSVNIPNPEYVVDNLVLPLAGPYGSVISWVSNHPGVISNEGIVVRSESLTHHVILTATFINDGVIGVKEFLLTVIPLDGNFITHIEDLTDEVMQGEEYILPPTVEALMSDGSFQNFSIVWNPATALTSTVGVFPFLGTVTGYHQSIKLDLTVIGATTRFSDLSVGDYIEVTDKDGKKYEFQKISDTRMLLRNADESLLKTHSVALSDAGNFRNLFNHKPLFSSSGLLAGNELTGPSGYDFKNNVLKVSYEWWLSGISGNQADYVNTSGNLATKNVNSANNTARVRPFVVLTDVNRIVTIHPTKANTYILD